MAVNLQYPLPPVSRPHSQELDPVVGQFRWDKMILVL
ncbi:hypothetical protein SAMN05216236_11744 [Sedimentitalea nanhaiensis]|uniref:Uncharacterized protein n=1 Tax=Sedimentitalea nanhaiensis TaxID=999627 RepID=A0A1I7CJV7_9RHOB|nr:hypothetical protein SAMN05216236_11744 [Sedimentitalea nanhaiensis]